MELTFKSGTYIITNKSNGKVYVGSSIHLEKREKEHFRTLRKGTHKNRFLQSSYNNNPNDFVFTVYELVPVEAILKHEQELLDVLYDCQDNCYNINPLASSSRGRVSNQTKMVYMFDANQILLAVYSSILKASLDTGINCASISLAANGKLKSSGGFLWSSSPTPPQRWKTKTNKTMWDRQVVSPSGDKLTFNNLRTLCATYDLAYKSMSEVLAGKIKSHRGWRV